MYSQLPPKYGAWSMDPYNAPNIANIAMTTASGIGAIQNQMARNQGLQQQNSLMQQTMPGLVSAQNAQNMATTQTAMPSAEAALKSAQFKANYPLATMPGMIGQIGGIQYLRDSSGGIHAVPVQQPSTGAPQSVAPQSATQQIPGNVPVAQVPQNGANTPISWQGNTPTVGQSPTQGLISSLANPGANPNMTPVNWQQGLIDKPMPAQSNAIPQNQALQQPNTPPQNSGLIQNPFSNAGLAQLAMNGVVTDQQAQMATALHNNAMTNSVGERYAPTIAKLQLIQNLESMGYNPAQAQQIAVNSPQAVDVTTNGIAPATTGNAQQDQINQANASQSASQTAGAITKQASDAATRDRATYANAISQTLQQIPVDSIVHYSGPSGRQQYYKDMALNVAGKADPNYTTLQSYINSTLPVLKGQMTKFYGGSVQPEAQKELDILGNPSNWSGNPQVAIQSLQRLQDVFNSEAGTFSKAASNGVQSYQPTTIPGLSKYLPQSSGSAQGSAPQTGWQSDGTFLGSDGNRYTRDQITAMRK